MVIPSDRSPRTAVGSSEECYRGSEDAALHWGRHSCIGVPTSTGKSVGDATQKMPEIGGSPVQEGLLQQEQAIAANPLPQLCWCGPGQRGVGSNRTGVGCPSFPINGKKLSSGFP